MDRAVVQSLHDRSGVSTLSYEERGFDATVGGELGGESQVRVKRGNPWFCAKLIVPSRSRTDPASSIIAVDTPAGGSPDLEAR